jgi:hypothetical protein
VLRRRLQAGGELLLPNERDDDSPIPKFLFCLRIKKWFEKTRTIANK